MISGKAVLNNTSLYEIKIYEIYMNIENSEYLIINEI